MKPLVIDLFCGLGGWARGFIAEGWACIGIDIQPQPEYPGLFYQADVIEVADCMEEGTRGWLPLMRFASIVVASPPCDDFSRWDQPWPNVIKNRREPDRRPWEAAERIARVIGCPLLIENVRGAQKFMGPARAHFGKQYLWGDVPALLPRINGAQNEGRQKQSLPSTAKARRAMVPFPLAQHIARVFKPSEARAG